MKAHQHLAVTGASVAALTVSLQAVVSTDPTYQLVGGIVAIIVATVISIDMCYW